MLLLTCTHTIMHHTHDCAHTHTHTHTHTHNQIDLVIGLLVGGTILFAIIVIAVAITIKKFRRREYDLLED